MVLNGDYVLRVMLRELDMLFLLLVYSYLTPQRLQSSICVFKRCSITLTQAIVEEPDLTTSLFFYLLDHLTP